MASCSLCASLRVKRSKHCFSTKDDARSHASQHFLQMKCFDEDSVNLEQVFEQCFPDFDVPPLGERKKTVKKEGRKTLLRLCHTLLDGRISKSSPRAICQKCGTGIGVWDKALSTRNFAGAIKHASVHLGIDLFRCRKCDRTFGTSSAVRHHLGSFHHLSGVSKYFTDTSGNFIAEITASIKRCFTEIPADKKGCMIGLVNEVRVRSNTKGSKMAVERNLFCYQCIRQLAGDDGKIQCRLCSNTINVKDENGYRNRNAMEHAFMHLRKPLYRCNLCSNVTSTLFLMFSHLKSSHSLPMSKNYECLADEFHNEIMSMLRKCYAEESESK